MQPRNIFNETARLLTDLKYFEKVKTRSEQKIAEIKKRLKCLKVLR